MAFFAFSYHPVYNFGSPNSNDSPYYQQKLSPGQYLFECWGASGGGNDDTMGKGGYVSGVLNIIETSVFYIVVGGAGERMTGGFNGGGDGGIGYPSGQDITGYGGGGATDIRIDIDHNSTIIIAGGGGGASGYRNTKGGHAGGIIGGSSRRNTTADPYCTHGPLSQGGNKENTTKWQGADALNKTYLQNIYCSREGNGGGGGGYYGGGTTTLSRYAWGECTGGGGGSSCISGHPECDVINDLYFSNITMYNGTELFLSPSGDLEYGHSGNGYARITSFKSIPTYENSMYNQNNIRSSFNFLFM